MTKNFYYKELKKHNLIPEDSIHFLPSVDTYWVFDNKEDCLAYCIEVEHLRYSKYGDIYEYAFIVDNDSKTTTMLAYASPQSFAISLISAEEDLNRIASNEDIASITGNQFCKSRYFFALKGNDGKYYMFS